MKPRVHPQVVTVAGIAVGVLATAAIGLPPAHAADEATVYIVQGLPDQTVDVAVDGETVASDVATTDVVGPFSVSAGRNEVSFTDEDGSVVADNTVTTETGSSSDLVVHMSTSATEDTVVTVFANDMTAVPADKASLTVAHTAAVPPADILVDGQVLFANVANGESLNLVVPVDTYEVQIVPTGETSPAILGPLDLTVEGGSLNRVYAVGDPENQTMNVAVHVIDLEDTGSDAPDMVNTGTGGQGAVLMQVNALLANLLW